jgi:hypothetical protein
MASLWREFVGVIDDQISVRDDRFWWDLRFLIWLPAFPFAISLCFIELPSTLGYIVGGLMFACLVPWVRFLLRRRAEKKRDWVEPTRFSNERNGY